MARPVSTIETHPQRQKIIDALLVGTPLRDIAAWAVPPVSTAGISRFKKRAVDLGRSAVSAQRMAKAYNDTPVSPPEAQAVTRAAMQALSSPFRPRLEQLWGVAERTLKRAEDAENLPAVAPLMAQAHKNLELLGRATGELAERDAPTVNVIVVCPSGPTAPAEPDDVLTIDIATK